MVLACIMAGLEKTVDLDFLQHWPPKTLLEEFRDFL